MIVKWKFSEVHGTETWTWPINPNEGGSPTFEKQLTISSNTGPNTGTIIQEGRMQAPVLSFSGSILTQEQYEKLEEWFFLRALLDLEDDLGRTFRGVFSAYSPDRARRASRPWYHTYSAQFTVWGYKMANGTVLFGDFS